MKKLGLSIALLLTALLGMSSAASATITSPAVGSNVTANGVIQLQGNILTTTCSITLTGRITSTTTGTVNSGAANRCSAGTFTFRALGTKRLLVASGVLTRQWSLGPIEVFVDTGLGITCTYTGTLGGTWALNAAGTSTVLTLGAPLQSVTLASGGAFCTSRPTIAGTITLLNVVTR